MHSLPQALSQLSLLRLGLQGKGRNRFSSVLGYNQQLPGFKCAGVKEGALRALGFWVGRGFADESCGDCLCV